MIDRIISTVGLSKDTTPKDTPAGKPLLNKDFDGLARSQSWHYRSVIGILSYLQGTSRPDITMAVHQCARFSNDPKLSHEKAVKRIIKYLSHHQRKNRGILCKPDRSKGIECFVDADFAGGWNQADALDASTCMSRTRCIMFYAGCPVIWCSKLQTEISLSTAEAEYIALSQDLR